MTTQPRATPQHQLAMVFDLNKCTGCQTCSVACKVLWTRDEGAEHQWWCITNTQPGRGTPKDWEQMGGGYRNGELVLGHVPTREEFGGGWEYNYEEVYFSGKGRTVHLQPKGDCPEWGPNWDEDEGAGEYPNSYFFYLPRLCNHCTHPACVEACPEGAMFKRDEDGIVLRNEDRCQGHRLCMAACPYKRIYFNHVRKVSQHCMFCFPRLEKNVAPSCVRQCPGRMIFVGYLDDPKGSIRKLVKDWQVALPLHPEFGTGPNVFYIPPLAPPRLNPDRSFDESTPRIPTEYLESLFGPGVQQALDTLKSEMEKKKRGESSELIDTLIAYRWQDLFGPFSADPAEIVWE